MTLKFGCLSADGDPDILKFFHVTEQAADIVDFTHPHGTCIFIGRQGSGKTAMTTWLTSQDNDATTVLRIWPETHRIVPKGNESNKTDIRFMAKLELMVEVGQVLVKENRLQGALLQEAKRLCCEGWEKALGKQWSRVKGGSAFGFGLQLDPVERADYLRLLRKDNRGTDLQELMRKIAQSHHVILVVDSPEDVIGQGIDTFTPDNAGRTGAMLAALADLSKTGVRVVCYVREQIYQLIQQEYDNSQHFEDQIDRLHWSSNDLVQLIEKRIAWLRGPDVQWSEVFDDASDEFITQVFPLLSNGPRDLVFLLNIAGRDRDRLGIGDIAACRHALKGERLTNLTSQHKQWKNVDQVAIEVLDGLLNEHRDGYFGRGEAHKIFRRLYTTSGSRIYNLIHKDDWVNHVQAGQPTIEEVLFSLGMLGFVDRQGKEQFPWANRSTMEFKSSDQYFVSALFQ